jgi:20S proteasome subunit beta 2
VAVITNEKTTLMRNYLTPNTRQPKQRNYRFPRGTTAVLNEKIITKEAISKYVTVHELKDDDVTGTAETMDIDA